MDKISSIIVQAFFKSLRGEEPIDLIGYYGKDEMRVTRKRKETIK